MQPDLVVLDLRLGAMDGLEVARRALQFSDGVRAIERMRTGLLGEFLAALVDND